MNVLLEVVSSALLVSAIVVTGVLFGVLVVVVMVVGIDGVIKDAKLVTEGKALVLIYVPAEFEIALLTATVAPLEILFSNPVR